MSLVLKPRNRVFKRKDHDGTPRDGIAKGKDARCVLACRWAQRDAMHDKAPEAKVQLDDERGISLNPPELTGVKTLVGQAIRGFVRHPVGAEGLKRLDDELIWKFIERARPWGGVRWEVP